MIAWILKMKDAERYKKGSSTTVNFALATTYETEKQALKMGERHNPDTYEAIKVEVKMLEE